MFLWRNIYIIIPKLSQLPEYCYNGTDLTNTFVLSLYTFASLGSCINIEVSPNSLSLVFF